MSASDPQVAGASEDGAASPTSFFKAASEFENAPPSPSNTDLSRGTLDGDLDSGLDYPEGRDLVDREGLLSGTLTLHSRSHATISEGYCFSPKAFFRTLLLFFGPAQMVAFGYVDPGNWALDITTGAAFGYRHLFIILFSTFLATLLQILALKLGVVANADLASQCKKSLHPVLNVALWLSAEIAIMATDVAEVIGSAFALNLIFGLPIWAGVLITIFDVLLIVIGLQKHLSHLEAVLSCFLLLVFGCLITILVKSNPVVMDLLIGLLPLDPTVITDQQGLYLSIGLIGATVMPHSLFLGSHLSQHHFEESVLRKLQSRDPISDDQLTHNILERTVHELDEELGHDSHDDEELDPSFTSSSSSSASNCTDMVVAPTPHTHHPHPSESQFDDSELVRQTSDFLFHSKLALWISLSVACLVNCAILAVAAANFYGVDQVVDGLSLAFEILRNGLGQSWAILFAISLLLSGQSATITSTIAGAVVMDGFLNLRMKPWVRRLLTRSFVILPSLFVAFYDGVDGLNKLLVFSQVVLSIQLPFSIAPLVRFTSDPELMGPFVNDSLTKWTAYSIASVLCFFNILVIFL